MRPRFPRPARNDSGRGTAVTAKRRNVLVFPGGTEIALEIWRALRRRAEVRLFSANADVSSHAPFVFRRHFTLPSVHEDGWLESLNRLIAEQAITHVFPAHDDVVAALAECRARIRATVVSSPPATCLTARSKSAAYAALGDVVPIPRFYSSATSVDHFPVFVRPDRASGSRGARPIADRALLAATLADEPDSIVCEYLGGAEFTVDCFSDRERGLLFVGGRARRRVRNGIAIDSVGVERPEFKTFAEAIAGTLPFHGAWFFQVKADAGGVLRLLEVAPRIAGTMALHRVQGVNFPLLSLLEADREPYSIAPFGLGAEIDRALTNRYRARIDYDTVVVAVDRVLFETQAVDIDVIGFLFQALGEGKRLVALTALDRAGFHREASARRIERLFDDVVRGDGIDSVAHLLAAHSGIYIDNDPARCAEAIERVNCPALDRGMIEVLIDDTA